MTRAAVLKGGVGTLLTGPEHAHLSDEDLLAEARRELEKVGIPDQYASIDDAMRDVIIDEWLDRASRDA